MSKRRVMNYHSSQRETDTESVLAYLRKAKDEEGKILLRDLLWDNDDCSEETCVYMIRKMMGSKDHGRIRAIKAFDAYFRCWESPIVRDLLVDALDVLPKSYLNEGFSRVMNQHARSYPPNPVPDEAVKAIVKDMVKRKIYMGGIKKLYSRLYLELNVTTGEGDWFKGWTEIIKKENASIRSLSNGVISFDIQQEGSNNCIGIEVSKPDDRSREGLTFITGESEIVFHRIGEGHPWSLGADLDGVGSRRRSYRKKNKVVKFILEFFNRYNWGLDLDEDTDCVKRKNFAKHVMWAREELEYVVPG